MDNWLYDPTTTHRLVLAQRPPTATTVSLVVSDLVWGYVVALLRWADAGHRATGVLQSGTWWRLASACADLLRRLPGLCDEVGEPWSAPVLPDDPGDGRGRAAAVARRLADRLRTGEQVPLWVLAAEVDALGSAAISALVESATR
jgi:hypothetical protein